MNRQDIALTDMAVWTRTKLYSVHTRHNGQS